MGLKTKICLLIFAVLALLALSTYFQWEPLNIIGNKIVALFTQANLNKVTASFYALIGGLGASLGGLTATIYAYTALKKQTTTTINTLQTSLSQKTSSIQNLLGENATLTDAKSASEKAIEEKQNLLAQVQTEKDSALQKVQSQEDMLKKAALEKETLVKQNIANFTQALPNDSIVMDPATGNLIKTVTKTVVK